MLDVKGCYRDTLQDIAKGLEGASSDRKESRQRILTYHKREPKGRSSVERAYKPG